MLERTVFSLSATMLMVKVALIAGSSQHGKARLASAAYLVRWMVLGMLVRVIFWKCDLPRIGWWRHIASRPTDARTLSGRSPWGSRLANQCSRCKAWLCQCSKSRRTRSLQPRSLRPRWPSSCSLLYRSCTRPPLCRISARSCSIGCGPCLCWSIDESFLS